MALRVGPPFVILPKGQAAANELNQQRPDYAGRVSKVFKNLVKPDGLRSGQDFSVIYTSHYFGAYRSDWQLVWNQVGTRNQSPRHRVY